MTGELDLLRSKLGRGPADLLVTLALLTDSLKSYKRGTVGPISACCVIPAAAGSTA